MKFSDAEFKELQQEWYARLKSAGFVDIETQSPYGAQFKDQHRNRLRRNKSSLNHAVCPRSLHNNDFESYRVTIDNGIHYYLELTHIVNDPATEFKTERDRMIMTLHSDGYSKTQISKFLKTFGQQLTPKSIIFLIRRYEQEWGLNNYNQKQLNRKTKPHSPVTT